MREEQQSNRWHWKTMHHVISQSTEPSSHTLAHIACSPDYSTLTISPPACLLRRYTKHFEHPYTLPYIFIYGYDFFCHPHVQLGHPWWIGYRPRLWGGEGCGSGCYCMPYLLFTPHPSTLFPERPSLVHFPFSGCFSHSNSKDIMVGSTVWWSSSSHPPCQMCKL